MASSSKRARPERYSDMEAILEEVCTVRSDDSDPGGMSDTEESDLDRQLEGISGNSR